MCKYCESGAGNMTEPLFLNGTVSVYVERAWDGSVFLIYKDRFGLFPLPINCCPKCGRNLKEESHG